MKERANVLFLDSQVGDENVGVKWVEGWLCTYPVQTLLRQSPMAGSPLSARWKMVTHIPMLLYTRQ